MKITLDNAIIEAEQAKANANKIKSNTNNANQVDYLTQQIGREPRFPYDPSFYRRFAPK